MTSNAELPNIGLNPIQEIQHQLANQVPAWGVSHLMGLENARALLADARQRTRDSHKAQMKALGVDTSDKAQVDEMGGISVQGDTTNTFHMVPLTQPSLQGGAVSGLVSKLIPLVLTLAVGSGAGVAGAWLTSHWNKSPSPPSQQQIVLPDYKLNLEVKDTP